jgi:aldehyde:ferredoxin oxidoreductase
MMVVCDFPAYTYQMEPELINAVTGWDTGIMELLKAAERTLTLARLFNMREGFSAKDDMLPERFFEPKTDGALSNIHIDRAAYERSKSFYYALMGWDTRGVPLSEKVEELCIE